MLPRVAALVAGLALAGASVAREGVSALPLPAASDRESPSYADTQTFHIAQAAQRGITAKNAWMRPAPAGADAARVYVDIVSDAAVDLVGASSPVAKSVAIVTVGTIGDPATEKVVKTLPLLAGTTTRLAYRGDHLRLVDLTRDVGNGDQVTITLTFRDKAGKRTDVPTDVTVRGLLLPQQVPEAARDAPAK